jgi:hypothetical protein
LAWCAISTTRNAPLLSAAVTLKKRVPMPTLRCVSVAVTCDLKRPYRVVSMVASSSAPPTVMLRDPMILATLRSKETNTSFAWLARARRTRFGRRVDVAAWSADATCDGKPDVIIAVAPRAIAAAMKAAPQTPIVASFTTDPVVEAKRRAYHVPGVRSLVLPCCHSRTTRSELSFYMMRYQAPEH